MFKNKLSSDLIIAVILLGLWLVGPAFGLSSATAAAPIVITEVKITNVFDVTFTVSWTTNQEVTGEVRYGTDPDNLDQIAYDTRGTFVIDDTHYATIQGLQPNTTYYFDVVSGESVDDQDGVHYTVTTGSELDIPNSETPFYGQVFKADGVILAEGTIVYITVFDDDGDGTSGEAAMLSSLVDYFGYWTINIGGIRTTDLTNYFDYSIDGDMMELSAQGSNDGSFIQIVALADGSPTPSITLASPPPDLVISKDDGQSLVMAGDTVTYTVTISNTGGQLASGVTLTDTLSTNTTFLAASNSASEAAGVVVWPTFDLAANTSVTRTVTARVKNPLLANVESITNTATITDDGTHGIDPTPENNTAFDINNVSAAPDLTISKDDQQIDVLPGQILTYTLAISNVGTQEATGVLITDTLPSHVSFIAASGGGIEARGVITWPTFDLMATFNTTRTVAVRVNDPFPPQVAAITNTATITDDGTHGADPTPENNAAIDVDSVIAIPDLTISKDDQQVEVLPGQVLTYTLTISNVGSHVASGVLITDTLPPHVSFVAASAGGTEASGIVIWPTFSLTPTSGTTRTVTVQVNDPFPAEVTAITNTVTITDDGVNGPDPTSDNNSAVDVNSVKIPPSDYSVWRDICVPHRMEMIGIGLGDRYQTINPQTVSLPDPANVNWLLTQVAGRSSAPDSVTFTTDTSSAMTMNEPSKTNIPHGYTFETILQPTGQVTASINNPGDTYKSPRSLTLYSKRSTVGNWTSVGKTMYDFVWAGGGYYTHTEILTFPPLTETTDLFLAAAIIDNDDDTRSLTLEAVAGNVTVSWIEAGSTDGKGLNIVNLLLPDVEAGTDQVMITFQSPTKQGDSGALVGLNVGYACPAPVDGATLLVSSPMTIPLGATETLTVALTPGSTSVNGVQIHGQVDPTYLQIVDVQPTGVFPVELDPVVFDPTTGRFRYGAGILNDVITEPVNILRIEVQAVATTSNTLVEFLSDFPPTDISGPSGSVMSQAQDGLVIITSLPVLQGSVEMQGRPAKPNPAWAVPLTVWLTLTGSSTPAYTFTTATDQYGDFTLDLPNVSPGHYDVGLKGNHTLRNLAPDTSLAAGDNRYYFDTLLEGDVETVATFNQILIQDHGVLATSLNKCQGDIDFVPNADLDENHCVSMNDFGLLSGNFNKQGDIIITPTPPASLTSREAAASNASLTFSPPDKTVTINEVVTVTINIDPGTTAVNGAMAHLIFDPDLIEIVDVALTDKMPLVLEIPVIDNQKGIVRFAVGILGQTITERFSIATLSLKVKAATPSTLITPINIFPATELTGVEGSLVAEAKGVTLKTDTEDHINTYYLPFLMRQTHDDRILLPLVVK
ncbi:MAG: DUF11 domain-containing protein [Anaerolineae bacterium]|nr:DUF11 domain-containing protein [Anaerolineae bacterium]